MKKYKKEMFESEVKFITIRDLLKQDVKIPNEIKEELKNLHELEILAVKVDKVISQVEPLLGLPNKSQDRFLQFLKHGVKAFDKK